MKSLLALFLFSLFVSPAWSVTAVIYDQDGRVTNCGDIPSTASAPANSIVLDSPNENHTQQEAAVFSDNREVFSDLRNRGIPYRHWKVVNGLLREMTQPEKDLVDAPLIQKQNQIDALIAERDSLEAEVDSAHTNWDSLLANQKVEALRKGMRLNRIYRLLGNS